MKRIAAGTWFPLLLVACKGAEAPPQQASDNGIVATSGSETSTVPSETQSTSAAKVADAGANIPVAMQGRWGLIAADCTTTNGDEKGLMIVSSDTLKFYESRGKLAKIAERSANRLRADFAYSGEGMEWKGDVTLYLQDGGKALIKRETDADAGPSTVKYARCKG